MDESKSPAHKVSKIAKMDESKSPAHKASFKIIKVDDPFIGFEKNDTLLETIDKKKNRLLHLFNKEKDTHIEVNAPLIVNNSHVNKKSPKSKSLSLPETNSKYNQNVQRLKKDDIRSEETEPDLNVQPSLELTTPTFNLTSPSPSRSSNRSSSRKQNVDIHDPIFKLPFDYGWKRELVYRSDISSSTNRPRNGDVYYYSPNNKKLRSTREIQEQLNLSLNENPLTIDSFTFVKQPIGMNDRTKEIIRDANAKVSKEDTFVVGSVRPKKVKSPGRHPVRTPVVQQFDYDLSDNENDKSSSKMKVVFKNVKRSRSSKKDKNILEVMVIPSSTPEHINENRKAVQPSATSVSSSKTDDIEKHSPKKKRRLSTSDGEVIMQAPCGMRCPNSQEPATLMCAQCLVYYHPACVNLNANLKIVGYVCINCRSLMRQRNKRVQSSHTVVVGASEPEQLRVEPIRIRQVHQASETPNFFIDRTPIFKTEEQNYEIDEQHINEINSSDINTVTCQGNVYKTVMTDGSFHEQYVYEMKQTRGPSLMVCVVQEPKNLDENAEINGSLREHNEVFASMQSFNYMMSAMRHVFKYLKLHELLIASRVCVAWNMIANDDHLWNTVSLKNSMVRDWEKCVETICRRNSVVLDTRRMLIPGKPEEFEHFWSKFGLALKNAKLLKCIELYRCPVSAVENAIYSLPQLTVLNATSLKNPTSSKTSHDLLVLNLNYLGQMVQLTELKLKGITGIKLTNLPSFEKLVNLKTLALTSIKAFPKDINHCLETVNKKLEFLEIGDAECLHVEFAMVLKRFTNLTSLRFENCVGKWNKIAKEVFSSIAGLEKLKILEFINIDFTDNVEDGLEKLNNIKALLVIPAYISQSATTNCHLIDCLKKLSKTLTHFVWGITFELLRVTDLFIAQFEKTQLAIGCDLDTLSQKRESSNNIPVLRTRRPRLQEGEDPAILEREREKDKSDNVDILSIPTLKELLQTMMEHAKIEIVKVNFAATNRVYLTEYFDDV